MKKINEIFYSIQGEGYFTGKPAIFIRFSGCNLSCSFCDTSHEEGNYMSTEEILEEVAGYPSAHVVLTGGEPSLYVTPELIAGLKSMDKFIQVETNGTNPLPVGIDWITCSPKPDSESVIRNPHELKVVYTGQDMSIYDSFDAQQYYMQPCSGLNTSEVINYIKNHPKWKLSLQTHKLINIR